MGQTYNALLQNIVRADVRGENTCRYSNIIGKDRQNSIEELLEKLEGQLSGVVSVAILHGLDSLQKDLNRLALLLLYRQHHLYQSTRKAGVWNRKLEQHLIAPSPPTVVEHPLLARRSEDPSVSAGDRCPTSRKKVPSRPASADLHTSLFLPSKGRDVTAVAERHSCLLCAQDIEPHSTFLMRCCQFANIHQHCVEEHLQRHPEHIQCPYW